jgi:hypothetical protein
LAQCPRRDKLQVSLFSHVLETPLPFMMIYQFDKTLTAEIVCDEKESLSDISLGFLKRSAHGWFFSLANFLWPSVRVFPRYA